MDAGGKPTWRSACGRATPSLITLNGQVFNRLHGEALNTHRASVGLPPVNDVRTFIFTDHPWLAADPALAPWQGTSDLDVVHTGAWILPDERPLPDDLVAFLDAGAPPVYVGLGSSRRVSQDVARAAIEAIRARGLRALVSRGWSDLGLVDDQDDCCAVGEANHQALFRRVAAVVHHGGAGTTTTAARAGAPQVVVPQAADQPYWAGRVVDLGLGAAHDGATPTVESLSEASARPWPPKRVHERGPWPARSAPTGWRRPPGCCSTRAMAKEMGLSQSTVSRIWRAFGLQPHRTETFKLSTDPYVVDKVHDVVGLYLDPPERALVFCVDEKSQSHALDRSQPVCR